MPRLAMHAARLLLGLVVAFLAQPGNAADWIAVTGDGRFTVQMPTTPEEYSEDLDTDGGRVTLHTYSSYGDDDALYSLSYTDFAAGALNYKTPDQFLRDAQSGSVRNSRTSLRSSQEITLGRWPGRAFVADNGKLVYAAHLYLVGDRFYQVVWINPKSAANGPDAAKFFESFGLAGQ